MVKLLIITVISALLIGCAAPMREVFLGAGEKVHITGQTSLRVWVNADKSFTVEAEDFVLGENLIIE